MTTTVQLRRGIKFDWTNHDPILAEGEMGLELDTGKVKFGNGAKHWSELSYVGGEGGGPGSTGYTGATGYTGYTGTKGDTGYTGYTMLRGLTKLGFWL